MDSSLPHAISILVMLTDAVSLLARSIFALDTTVVVFLVLLWGYSTLLEGFVGRSLGKRVIGLRVVKIDGKRLFCDAAFVEKFRQSFSTTV
jgi:uncharacterized RDD family membrane protein YckC